MWSPRLRQRLSGGDECGPLSASKGTGPDPCGDGIHRDELRLSLSSPISETPPCEGRTLPGGWRRLFLVRFLRVAAELCWFGTILNYSDYRGGWGKCEEPGSSARTATATAQPRTPASLRRRPSREKLAPPHRSGRMGAKNLLGPVRETQKAIWCL